MIAQIIPIKRLPRGLDLFDYHVPEELANTLCPGQLVTVPFRKSTVYGLVFSLLKNQKPLSKSIKDIETLIHKEPLVSKQSLEYTKTLSDLYGVSYGTIAKMSMPPMQKRKLKKITCSTIKKTPKQKKIPPTFHAYKKNKERINTIESLINGQTLILVPEIDMAEKMYRLLSKKNQAHTLVWHSNLSAKEKFERWFLIRNQEKKIIIATRAGVFLPLFNLKTIIIDAEHDDNHKHRDQAPRFHAKDVAGILSNITGAQLHLASFVPSLSTYFFLHKKKYQSKKPLRLKKSSASVVNMADERRGKNFSLFSNKLEDALFAATQDVFLFINRLGFATSVGCRTCDHREICPNCQTPLVYHSKTNTLLCHYCRVAKKLPRQCPQCGSTVVQLRGIGTEQVDTLVRQLLGNRLRHNITRIDSQTSHTPPITKSAQPNIYIGTEMAFHHIPWKETELIAFLDIDKQLTLPEYMAGEHVWDRIAEVDYKKNPLSTFLIQTFNPKQLVIKSLREPDRFYRTDLNHRRTLGYPPYHFLVRYFFGHEHSSVAKKQTDSVRSMIEQFLTTHKNPGIVSYSIEMHPRFYRRKYWFMILVKLPYDSWQTDLTRLNTIIPHGWKIDPNPTSILSP